MPTAWWPSETNGEGEAAAIDRGQEMVKAAKQLEANPDESTRQDLNVLYVRQFESSPLTSLYQFGGSYFTGGSVSYTTFNLEDISTWNVSRSVIMTLAAMIGRNKPRGRFVTTNGRFGQRRRAKKASQFVAGWAKEVDLYALTFETLVDALVTDGGYVQLYEEGGRVKIQRVLANEITFDQFDGMYGAPRTMYRRRPIAKDVLLAKFGKKSAAARSAIESAETISAQGSEDAQSFVWVREAWHLPATDKSGDGYHLIAVEGEGGTLFEEEWTKPYFPILGLHYEKARTGPYGRSLMGQLSPLQTSLNRLLMRIDKAQRLLMGGKIAIKRGSRIIKSQLSNQIAGILEYTDTPPQPLEWKIMQPEIYSWVETVVQKFYDLPGISRNASQGVKEPGLNSGAAIRESIDLQATRVQTFAQSWEQFHVRIFEIVTDMVADIVADGVEEEVESKVRKRVRKGRGYAYRVYTKKTTKKKCGSYKVVAPGNRLLEPIDWAELEIDRAEYTVECYPVSNLPMTPQGRLDFVSEMLTSGLWDIERAKTAMDDLDVQEADDVQTAIQRLIDKQMEGMIYDGVPSHPDEFMPYQQLLKNAALYLALGVVDGAPKKHLALLRRYVDEAKAIQKQMAANAPPPPAPAAQDQPAQ